MKGKSEHDYRFMGPEKKNGFGEKRSTWRKGAFFEKRTSLINIWQDQIISTSMRHTNPIQSYSKSGNSSIILKENLEQMRKSCAIDGIHRSQILYRGQNNENKTRTSLSLWQAETREGYERRGSSDSSIFISGRKILVRYNTELNQEFIRNN